MKKQSKFLGIIALTAIIGFSMTSCGSDGDSIPTPSIPSLAVSVLDEALPANFFPTATAAIVQVGPTSDARLRDAAYFAVQGFIATHAFLGAVSLFDDNWHAFPPVMSVETLIFGAVNDIIGTSAEMDIRTALNDPTPALIANLGTDFGITNVEGNIRRLRTGNSRSTATGQGSERWETNDLRFTFNPGAMMDGATPPVAIPQPATDRLFAVARMQGHGTHSWNNRGDLVTERNVGNSGTNILVAFALPVTVPGMTAVEYVFGRARIEIGGAANNTQDFNLSHFVCTCTTCTCVPTTQPGSFTEVCPCRRPVLDTSGMASSRARITFLD